jgi:citrate lyase subunit beta/citryl-CoA lyase
VEALEGTQRARLLVRINAEGTPWHAEDLRALAQLVEMGVAGVVVSKAERAQTLHAVARAAGAQAALLPLIESVAGLDAAAALAAAPRVVRLAFGHLDFRSMQAWPAGWRRKSCCPCAWPWSWPRAAPALARSWTA